MKYKFSLFLLGLFLLAVPTFAQLQLINTIAGNGTEGYSGDGSSAAAAEFFDPEDVVLDNAGNIYIEDHMNYRIRKINASGNIYTIAGTGVFGNTGDGSIATSANIAPDGLAIDASGNLYISSASFNVVRKISTTGIISTIAGISGHGGYTGDSAAAVSATLNAPHGLAIDTAGNLYIADEGNNVIRMVSAAGIITTIAGTGVAGYFGDGALAVYAQLDSPTAVAVDKQGKIYISDSKNSVVRRIDTAIISTYAGVYDNYGYNGDSIAAATSYLNWPRGLAVDTNNFLYIADANNNRIRKVDTSGIITTAAGNGYAGFGGDLGTVNGANLHNPYGVAVDNYGSIYIADANNERIRKTYNPGLAVAQIANQSHISAFPDPFTGSVSVSGLSATDVLIVSDMSGKQVSTTTAGTFETQLSLNNLAKGMYMLQVYDNSGSKKAVVKLVKD